MADETARPPVVSVANPAPDADAQARREEEIRAGLAASGGGEQAATELVQQDYFTFDEVFRVVLPDGVSYIEHKLLNEAGRRKYLNSVNREVRLDRASQGASIRTAPGDERKALLEQAICGWNLKRSGQAVEFKPSNVRTFLDNANPKVLELIEKDVRLQNPWLLTDLTVEQIDDEIDSLTEMRKRIVEEEERGKSS